jgi:hypothetical protein
MTDGSPRPGPDHDADSRDVIRVPGPPGDGVQDPDGGLVKTGDLGSASRSCLAIIAVLVVILLLLCVFFAVQTFA